MPTPTFRFTLSHTSLSGGSVAIREPLGWKQATLVLERDDKFHSLIEYFEAPLTFYGDGLTAIKGIQEVDGVDAEISILIEIKFDELIGWEELFDGIVDSSTTDEESVWATPYKAKLAIIRNDLWAKFISRLDTPVNLSSTVDLFGNTVTPTPEKTLNLPTQVIRQIFSGTGDANATTTLIIPNTQFAQLDFANVSRDEIKTRFSIGTAVSPTKPVSIFTAEFSGAYNFDALFYFFQGSFIGSTALDNNVKIKIQIGSSAPVLLTKTDETSGIDSWSKYTYSGDLTVAKGEAIRIYVENLTGSSQTINWYAGISKESHLIITAETIYVDSYTPGFLLHDAFKGVVDRITEPDKFYSAYLGHTSYTSIAYDETGCGFRYLIARGLNIRGFTLTEKPFFSSLNEIWDGADPILNLGLGYETIDDEERIIVDKKEAFYDDSSHSVEFFNVDKMGRVYDTGFLPKDIRIGYNKWQAESTGVIDDPQTVVNYSTRFQRVGKPVEIMSKFIAASLVWEATRRLNTDKTKDWRFDNDTFIASINTTEVDTDTFTPELDENFSGISGLLNPETRYNYRLWPVWNFLRWSTVFAGALQKYLGSVYRFVSGEGNFNVQATMAEDSECLLVGEPSIAQNQNIDISIEVQRGDIIHSEELYSATIPVSWIEYKAIRDNRKKAIGISRTSDPANTFLIKRFAWKIYKGEAELSVWAKPALIEPNPDYIWQWESGDDVQWESSAVVNLESAP